MKHGWAEAYELKQLKRWPIVWIWVSMVTAKGPGPQNYRAHLYSQEAAEGIPSCLREKRGISQNRGGDERTKRRMRSDSHPNPPGT